MKDLLKVETQKLAVSSATFLQEKHDNADADVVDCPHKGFIIPKVSKKFSK